MSKVCWNCDHVIFSSGNSEEYTRCDCGHWTWEKARTTFQEVLKRNNTGCEDWELLKSLRGKRGAETGGVFGG